MPRDPSGTYTAPANSFNPAVDATTIDPEDWNAILLDLSDAMTDSLSRTAEGGMEDTLDMDGHAIINATIDTAGPNTIQVDGVTIARGQYPGTATNDAATAGNEGEVLSGTGSAVLTTTIAANIASVSLTAGDWDVWVTGLFSGASNTVTSDMRLAISAVSATIPTLAAFQTYAFRSATGVTDMFNQPTVGPFRVSLAGTTTYFAVAQATFITNTFGVTIGAIRARRVR